MPKEASDWRAAGSVGDYALYKMCAEFPGHDNHEIVASKMLLIARAYSVARNLGSDYQVLAKAVCASSAELHELLQRAKARGFSDGVKRALKCHAFLDSIVCGALKGGKHDVRGRASFCSKYLHFHAPDAFPILDSFASCGVRSKTPSRRFTKDTPPYERFCTLFAQYSDNHGRGRSLRVIDHELVALGKRLTAAKSALRHAPAPR